MLDRRCLAKKWTGVLCPEIEKIIRKNLDAGRNWYVRQASEDVFEVSDDGSYTVNLSHRSCFCRMWQIKGLPCSHACVAAQTRGLEIYGLIEDYFKSDFFRKSYACPIYPVPSIPKGMKISEDGIKPPTTRKQPGRPRVNRIKSAGEVRKIRCGRCGSANRNNRKICTAVI